MKYYKAEFWYNPSITCVEVDKESDKSVWINGRACRKETDDTVYFKSFELAKEWLFSKNRKRFESAKSEYEYEKERFERLHRDIGIIEQKEEA